MQSMQRNWYGVCACFYFRKKFKEFSPDVSEISTIDFYTIPALIEKCKNEKETFSGSFLHLFQLTASRLESYSNDS